MTTTKPFEPEQYWKQVAEKALAENERLTAVVADLENCQAEQDFTIDSQTDRIAKLEAALVEVANSGVGTHSAWGWLAPFAHKALEVK